MPILKNETNYLGFKITGNGIKPDTEKVETIRSLPAPINVKEVRSFIGMLSYYRRFVPNFSKISIPLVELTKKYAKFNWTDECQRAFEYLKDSLTVIPLLAYPDLTKRYTLYTDASDDTIGACLTQPCNDNEEVLYGVKNEKPIYFLSHKLSDTQTRWSTIEKEAFSIHYALQKLDHYLHNAEFTIKTDHKPLKYILESPMQNKKIQLWALGITGYNCKIEWLAGTENTIADYLSRRPNRIEVNKSDNKKTDDEDIEIDISNKAYEINTINSNEIDPKKFASCSYKETDTLTLKDFVVSGYDMKYEQSLDKELALIISQMKNGKASKSVESQADKDKQLRKTTYVVPPESSDKESENETDSENSSMEGVEQTRDKLIRRYKNERESSSGEDDIPLMELTKRVKYRKKRIKAQYENTTDEEDNIPLLELQNNLKSRVTTSETRSISLDANSSEDEAMSVNHFIEKPAKFAFIAYSGCHESLAEKGILPSIIKQIYKTWSQKARLFHENRMMGTIFRDSYKTFFDSSHHDRLLIPSLVKEVVDIVVDRARNKGFFYLHTLRLQMENQIRISHDMVKSSALAQTVLRRYEQPGKETFYNTFSNLEQEFNLLMDMHRSITDSFDDFKTLHRHRRSVLPFIGSAMSFLFGTLTEDDINLIKGNVRTLAQNQKKISHILTENLSILNITRLEVSQNRDAINKLSRGLQDLDIRLVNITEAIENK
ncbi:unnamed protein product [Mytilus coruscus]|uniref:Reverse transcriptase RNase H-like domain-containing protein n=1 Tax=Mytilus coruscus TaxID=42192 RepID=A0A6J8E3Q3_MYTCO|nr:unnamed protein product [Mytilus coruscus]